MGVFKRLFKIGQAETNAAIDKLEDPIKITEQGIRDLKKDLDSSLKAFAELKSMTIRSRKAYNENKSQAGEYEQKAIALLKKAETGQIEAAEADRLASMALQKQQESANTAKVEHENLKKLENQVAQMDGKIKQLKSTISKYENELRSLKARAKVSKATQNVNKQLAQIDSSSTVSMLERMKEKVEKQEALSDAYADIADENKSLDEEIDSALGDASLEGGDALKALKAKMAQNNPNNPSPPPLDE